MLKSRIKITNKLDLNKLPVTISCQNDQCCGNVTFKIGDVEAKKTIACASCGARVNLGPTQQSNSL